MVGRKKQPGEDRPGWGGPRGGGRPPTSPLGKAQKISATLFPNDFAYVLRLGEGSVTEGLRRIIREHRCIARSE